MRAHRGVVCPPAVRRMVKSRCSAAAAALQTVSQAAALFGRCATVRPLPNHSTTGDGCVVGAVSSGGRYTAIGDDGGGRVGNDTHQVCTDTGAHPLTLPLATMEYPLTDPNPMTDSRHYPTHCLPHASPLATMASFFLGLSDGRAIGCSWSG